jgi:hypothetical protein
LVVGDWPLRSPADLVDVCVWRIKWTKKINGSGDKNFFVVSKLYWLGHYICFAKENMSEKAQGNLFLFVAYYLLEHNSPHI